MKLCSGAAYVPTVNADSSIGILRLAMPGLALGHFAPAGVVYACFVSSHLANEQPDGHPGACAEAYSASDLPLPPERACLSARLPKFETVERECLIATLSDSQRRVLKRHLR